MASTITPRPMPIRYPRRMPRNKGIVFRYSSRPPIRRITVLISQTMKMDDTALVSLDELEIVNPMGWSGHQGNR